MSRIGNQPIPLPQGVTVEVSPGLVVKVIGPNGTLEERISPRLSVEQSDGVLEVKRRGNAQDLRALHGLSRSLINNMVVGVTEGYTRILEVHGDFYRASMNNSTLVLQVGKSHPVEYLSTDEIILNVDQSGRVITLQGNSKRDIGQLAAEIRGERPPVPYGGSGIRYRGERVRSKAGKAGKANT